MKTMSGNDGVLPREDPQLSEEDMAPVAEERGDPNDKHGTLRVVVADDHDALRRYLCRFLREAGGLDVVGEAANGQEAVALTQQLVPDMVLMDVRMPHVDGIEAMRRIACDHPAVKVLAVSADWHRTMVTHMLAAGALGCVSKAASYDTLLHAVRVVSTGRRYLCPEVASLFKNAGVVEGCAGGDRPCVALSALPERQGTYLAFALGDGQYGLEVGKVREIMGYIQVIPKPHASSHIHGVIDFRGKEIPVMDLRARFGMVATEATDQTCVLIVETARSGRPYNVGIIIDRIQGVLDVALRDIDEAPKSGAPVDAGLLLGAIRAGESVMFLLDIDRVCDSEAPDRPNS